RLCADASDRRPGRAAARRCRHARRGHGLRPARRPARTHRLGGAHSALAQLFDRPPLARRTGPRAACTTTREGIIMTAIIQTIETPDGALTILADDAQRVLASGWSDDQEAVIRRVHPSLRPDDIVEGTTDAADAARAYYAGDLSAIDDVAVRQYGTELQQAGWTALRRIAPGRPLTYSGFAIELGSPQAVRAAASICARNAPALFVPCHRVLRADGSLGGFAWGLPVKRSLLDRESGALAS